MIPEFIDAFFDHHPWASDILGSVLGVFITAVLFVAGIVYERRRQRALENRVYEETLYYLEQLLGRVIDWAGQLARAYRSVGDGLRRAPLLAPEFGQYSDYAIQRLREVDRQMLFRAFLHRYGRSTATIDLYVGFYDALDYVIQQRDTAETARTALLQGRPALETQFRKAFDNLLNQTITMRRQLGSTPLTDSALARLLDEMLPRLHQHALPGVELEEAWQGAVEPANQALLALGGDYPQVTELLRRTQKLTSLRAALWQQGTEAATSFALLGTALQLGMGTLRSAQRRMLATRQPAPRGGLLRSLRTRFVPAAAAPELPNRVGEQPFGERVG